jgi:hypothetical protein
MTKTLNQQISPVEEVMAVEPCEDPFGYLRNKMAADELISEQIEHTLMFENVQNSQGLSKEECRTLILQAE